MDYQWWNVWLNSTHLKSLFHNDFLSFTIIETKNMPRIFHIIYLLDPGNSTCQSVLIPVVSIHFFSNGHNFRYKRHMSHLYLVTDIFKCFSAVDVLCHTNVISTNVKSTFWNTTVNHHIKISHGHKNIIGRYIWYPYYQVISERACVPLISLNSSEDSYWKNLRFSTHQRTETPLEYFGSLSHIQIRFPSGFLSEESQRWWAAQLVQSGTETGKSTSFTMWTKLITYMKFVNGRTMYVWTMKVLILIFDNERLVYFEAKINVEISEKIADLFWTLNLLLKTLITHLFL